MKYRDFGKLDWKPSALGMGCMRLPTKGNAVESPDVLEDEAIRLIRSAIDSGINYVDTAYVYHGRNGENVLGKALKNGYRDKVKVSTKAPMSLIQTADEFDQYLEKQLQKLGVDTIDVYLLHALNQSRWEIIKNQDILHRAEQAKREGKIKHIGFSFHDGYPVFETILNEYDGWEVCLLQYNYLDTMSQSGEKGIKLAASKGLGIAVMEPLRGGTLLHAPQEVLELLRQAKYEGTLADLAFQWLWDQPEVGVVLSGMGNMEQLRQNITSAEKSRIGSFGEKDKNLIRQIQNVYAERKGVGCTACGYCMPCPASVNIPLNLKFYQDGQIYNHFDEAKRRYMLLLTPEQRASACTGCKSCEEKCPQGIPISSLMPQVDEVLR